MIVEEEGQMMINCFTDQMIVKGGGEGQFFISMKYIKNRKIEIEYTSNSHITSWQSQSLRNRSPNKVEVSSWD